MLGKKLNLLGTNQEINKLVAEFVLGLTYDEYFGAWYKKGAGTTLEESISKFEWNPSADIADAKKIQSAMLNLNREKHGGMTDLNILLNPYTSEYRVKVSWSNGKEMSAFSESEAMAICLCSLLVAEVPEDRIASAIGLKKMQKEWSR